MSLMPRFSVTCSPCLPAHAVRRLRESPRSLPLCVIFSSPPSRPHRLPIRRPWPPAAAVTPFAAIGGGSTCNASCNSQLQLAAFLRSVDDRGLNWTLSPFRINTSKKLCTFCISLICGHLKSPIINTSVNFDFKLPIINTSKKSGGGGSSCNSSCNWGFTGHDHNARPMASAPDGTRRKGAQKSAKAHRQECLCY